MAAIPPLFFSRQVWGPAVAAGIQSLDLVKSVNGRPVSTLAEMQKLASEIAPGGRRDRRMGDWAAVDDRAVIHVEVGPPLPGPDPPHTRSSKPEDRTVGPTPT